MHTSAKEEGKDSPQRDGQSQFSLRVAQISQSAQFSSLIASLFQQSTSDRPRSPQKDQGRGDGTEKEAPEAEVDAFAVMPPLEMFAPQISPQMRYQHFFNSVGVGDVLVGRVESLFYSGVSDSAAVLLQLLYWDLCVSANQAMNRYLADLKIKVLCDKSSLPSRKFVEPSKQQTWKVKVTSVAQNDSDKVRIKSSFMKLFNPELNDDGGLNSQASSRKSQYLFDSLSTSYKRSVMMEPEATDKNPSYDSFLHKIVGFSNPTCSHALLSSPSLLNCPSTTPFPSLWTDLYVQSATPGADCDPNRSLESPSSQPPHNQPPIDESALSLRQWQNNTRSLKSVGKGVACFKQEKYVEAMQHFNCALDIDPDCVEGLVARGALHSKLEVFPSAISDLKSAIKLKPSHKNANKYLLETFLSYAHKEEGNSNLIKAEKIYKDALEQFSDSSQEVIQVVEAALENLSMLKKKLVSESDGRHSANEAAEEADESQKKVVEQPFVTNDFELDTSITARQIQKWLNKEKQNLKKRKKKEKRQAKKSASTGAKDKEKEKEREKGLSRSTERSPRRGRRQISPLKTSNKRDRSSKSRSSRKRRSSSGSIRKCSRSERTKERFNQSSNGFRKERKRSRSSRSRERLASCDSIWKKRSRRVDRSNSVTPTKGTKESRKNVKQEEKETNEEYLSEKFQRMNKCEDDVEKKDTNESRSKRHSKCQKEIEDKVFKRSPSRSKWGEREVSKPTDQRKMRKSRSKSRVENRSQRRKSSDCIRKEKAGRKKGEAMVGVVEIESSSGEEKKFAASKNGSQTQEKRNEKEEKRKHRLRSASESSSSSHRSSSARRRPSQSSERLKKRSRRRRSSSGRERERRRCRSRRRSRSSKRSKRKDSR